MAKTVVITVQTAPRIELTATVKTLVAQVTNTATQINRVAPIAQRLTFIGLI
jgi:hypothetical protein